MARATLKRFNENLAEERPKGGLSPDALLAVAGERVIVEIYDLRSRQRGREGRVYE